VHNIVFQHTRFNARVHHLQSIQFLFAIDARKLDVSIVIMTNFTTSSLRTDNKQTQERKVTADHCLCAE